MDGPNSPLEPGRGGSLSAPTTGDAPPAQLLAEYGWPPDLAARLGRAARPPPTRPADAPARDPDGQATDA